MQRVLTITVDGATYGALVRLAGSDSVNTYVANLLREIVIPTYTAEELDAGYRAMAADEEAEREALEWAEALIGDSFPDSR